MTNRRYLFGSLFAFGLMALLLLVAPPASPAKSKMTQDVAAQDSELSRIMPLLQSPASSPRK
jgi:hypothetical protein